MVRNSLRVGALLSAFCLALSVIAGTASIGANAQQIELTKVKFGIEALSTDQLKELWEKVDAFADFEAYLISCRSSSNIEKRIVDSVGRCVTPAALQSVRQRFHQRRAKNVTSYIKEYCDSAHAKKLMSDLHNMINKIVAEAAASCRACFIC